MHILLKRKTQRLIFSFATFCTVAISIFAITPAYKFKIHILVNVGREDKHVPAIRCSTPVISSNHKARIISETAILNARFLIQNVVTFFNFATFYPDLDPKKAAF